MPNRSKPKISSTWANHLLVGALLVMLVVAMGAFVSRFENLKAVKSAKKAASTLKAQLQPSPTPSAEPKRFMADTDPFVLGRFTFNPDPKYIPRSLRNVQYNGSVPTYVLEPAKVVVSQTEPNAAESCVQVGGMYSVFTDVIRNNNRENAGVYANSWDTSSVTYLNSDIEQKFKARATEVEESLEKYTDYNLLYQDLFGDKTEALYPGVSLANFNYCSGGYNYPLYIQKVYTANFDKAYYVEANAGNGTHEQLPHRTLILKKGTNWLTITEQPETNTSINWSECINANYETSKEELKCVERITRNYRNQAVNNAWIWKMMSAVTYTE